MVLGNGMVANAFRQYDDDNSVIIFASGVSNSKEDDDSKFEREFELLRSYRHLADKKEKKLIYFSTCSIFDESVSDLKYIKFKKNIEEFIANNFSQYIIFRLPNVIGNTGNNNTSFNFFKNSISNQEEIRVQRQAIRYIIDIDDLRRLLPFFISNSSYKKNIINVCFDNKISVVGFVELIEKILGISASVTLCDGGLDYSVDNTEFIQALKTVQDYFPSDDYNFNILKKYLVQ